MKEIDDIREAILSHAPGEEIGSLELPTRFRAAVIRRTDVDRVTSIPPTSRDPRDALHIVEIGTPELAPDECLVAVMASAINFNTIWGSTFAPVPTFAFLDRFARTGYWARRHGGDEHVLGSDAAGVVLRSGSLVRRWRPGDRVIVHPTYVDGEDPQAQSDSMLSPSQLVWGFETNFGGLAELTVVKASQLLPKAPHLTWEEAGSFAGCAGTSYRMLVSRHGADMHLGDKVLLWGATGGIGVFGLQLALAAGATPLGVVSSPERRALLAELGVPLSIDRRAENYRFWSDEHTQDESEWRRFGSRVRTLLGQDPDIVFEHPGRDTMGASVFTCARGGTIVTCAATTGYQLEFDNRHLWMKLKRIVSTHMANYAEVDRMNRLVHEGVLYPALSATYDLADVATAAHVMQQNRHEGKLGVLALAPKTGLGIDDPARRELIGESRLTTFTRALDRVYGVSSCSGYGRMSRDAALSPPPTADIKTRLPSDALPLFRAESNAVS